MKHKTLKRVLCFLLALVVVASMPLDIHANAVAVAPWAVYALITYMAAVGITFTVTGGVDAMVKAVQDKVDEYEKTVSLPLPIWVVIEEGTKLVPPPSGGGPNWNPNRGKFFFTANATAAITAFITWLVSDGGWSDGETVEKEITTGIFNAVYNNNSDAVCSTTIRGSGYTQMANYIYDIDSLGTVIPFNDFVAPNNEPYIIGRPNQANAENAVTVFGVHTSASNVYNGFDLFSNNDWLFKYDNGNSYQYVLSQIASGNGYTVNDFEGIVFFDGNATIDTERAFWGILTKDNKIIYIGDIILTGKFNFISDVRIDTPVEIPQLQPSTQQGVYIDTSADAETLEELAEDIKTQFEETGTIPRPVPEVITDPDFAPQPSPVPTPPVYEDVDGLGLPSLAETMKNKFPFCLPYDLGRVFEIFYAEPVAPYWEVDLFATLGNRVPFVGDTSFTIDLAEYEELGTISRWMTTIGYTLLLILITRQTIKW